MSIVQFNRLLAVLVLFVPAVLLPGLVSADGAPKPGEVEYFFSRPNPTPFLANGVGVGKNVAVFYTAGTGPAGANPLAEPGTPERYIDYQFFPGYEYSMNSAMPPLPEGVTITEAQGYNALNRVQQLLQAQGLSLKDVIFLRIYLSAPPGEEIADFSGWNRAYFKFFANVNLETGETVGEPFFENATRPARSNLEVANLPVPGWLVELEAIAAYPK